MAQMRRPHEFETLVDLAARELERGTYDWRQWPQNFNIYPSDGSGRRGYRLPSVGVQLLLGNPGVLEVPAIQPWLDQLLDAMPGPFALAEPSNLYEYRLRVALGLLLRYGFNKASGWHTALSEHTQPSHNIDQLLCNYLFVARDSELELFLRPSGPTELPSILRSLMDMRRTGIFSILAARAPEAFLCYGPGYFGGEGAAERHYRRAAMGLLDPRRDEVAQTLATMRGRHSSSVVDILVHRFTGGLE